MARITTIALTKQTKLELDKLKLHYRESYEGVIKRLISYVKSQNIQNVQIQNTQQSQTTVQGQNAQDQNVQGQNAQDQNVQNNKVS